MSYRSTLLWPRTWARRFMRVSVRLCHGTRSQLFGSRYRPTFRNRRVLFAATQKAAYRPSNKTWRGGRGAIQTIIPARQEQPRRVFQMNHRYTSTTAPFNLSMSHTPLQQMDHRRIRKSGRASRRARSACLLSTMSVKASMAG